MQATLVQNEREKAMQHKMAERNAVKLTRDCELVSILFTLSFLLYLGVENTREKELEPKT